MSSLTPVTVNLTNQLIGTLTKEAEQYNISLDMHLRHILFEHVHKNHISKEDSPSEILEKIRNKANPPPISPMCEEEERSYLIAKGWEHVMTEEEGCDTWSYPWSERKKKWPLWALKSANGGQHYWDRNEAVELQERLDEYEYLNS